MVPYYGDILKNSTIRIPFNTFDSNNPSASIAPTGLVDADVLVYKDGALTETTVGTTIEISQDGDIGSNVAVIATTDAFYAIGSEYMVKLRDILIDGAIVNAWIGSFSIQNRPANLGLIQDQPFTGSVKPFDVAV